MPPAERDAVVPPRRGAGPAPGPDRAAADLLLGPHEADLARGCDVEPDDGRSFELALHGAACLALASRWPGRSAATRPPSRARGAWRRCWRSASPAIAGLTLRGARSSGGSRVRGRPPAGLLAGAAGDGAGGSQRRPGAGRAAARGRPLDGLVLGVAQALALAPGVSRNGATLTAARARGFARPAAQRLSWAAGLPVMGGASAAEALRGGSGGRPGRTPGSCGGSAGRLLLDAAQRAADGPAPRARRRCGPSPSTAVCSRG